MTDLRSAFARHRALRTHRRDARAIERALATAPTLESAPEIAALAATACPPAPPPPGLRRAGGTGQDESPRLLTEERRCPHPRSSPRTPRASSPTARRA